MMTSVSANVLSEFVAPMKANRRPSHMRVTSIQSSVSTVASLGEDGECTDTESSDTSPRSTALMVSLAGLVRESAPITVKNTFVEMDIPKPLEWDGCFEHREVQSAPGSVFNSPVTRREDPWFKLDQVCSDGESDSEQDEETSCSSDQKLSINHPMPSFFFQQQPPTLRLAEAIEPPPVFAAIPTVGSAGHGLRKCKPCAFVWKESGCQSGTSCKFCHLCDPAEKKRRRKAKLQLRRDRSMKKAELVQ